MQAPKVENADHDSIENQSEVSDCTTAKSIESLSSHNAGSLSHPMDAGSRVRSPSYICLKQCVYVCVCFPFL